MSDTSLDALLPPEMAAKAEELGVKKATMPRGRLFALAVLAGAFIGFGAMLSTIAPIGSGSYGTGRLITGAAFSLGLVLVVVGGAELFTGNNLIVMAWASRRVSTRAVLTSWLIAFVGNFVGAIALASVVFWSGQHHTSNGSVGARAVEIGAAKTDLGFVRAFWLGVLANVLVCLAVWLTYSCRSVVDKVVAIVFPVTAFVAAGFEHSIANMYLIPMALFVRRSEHLDVAGLTWDRFVTHNLVPVTAGNIVGGAGVVGLVYWVIYRRGAIRTSQ